MTDALVIFLFVAGISFSIQQQESSNFLSLNTSLQDERTTPSNGSVFNSSQKNDFPVQEYGTSQFSQVNGSEPQQYDPDINIDEDKDPNEKFRRGVPEASYLDAINESEETEDRFSGTTDMPSGILSQDQDYYNYNGSFAYSFKTENGINTEAKGYQKISSSGEEIQVMEGEYSYTSPEGTRVVTKWYADETGFHANVMTIPASAASA